MSPRGLLAGQDNLAAFKAFVASVADWKPYVDKRNPSHLNKSQVGRECGLNRNVFATNEDIKAELSALEDSLRAIDVLTPKQVIKAGEAPPERFKGPSVAERRRAESNETQVVALQAEVDALKSELSKAKKALDEASIKTDSWLESGRLPWA